MLPIPTTAHNEALSGDTLYSAFLNYEWRELVVPAIVERLFQIAATIDDEGDRQDFEVRIGALIDDLYDEDDVDLLPVGTILMFAVQTPPSAKWLCCNGGYVSQSTYADLYELIGEKYGMNSGSDFKLPQLVQRFPYGGNSTGTDTIGFAGGTETETLTLSQIPSHHHTIAHTHLINQSDGTGTQARAARGTTTITASLITTQPSTPDSGDAGGGGSHNNLPPYLTVLFMIKALP